MHKKICNYLIDDLFSKKTYRFIISMIILVMCYLCVSKYKNLDIFEALGNSYSDMYFLCLCFFPLSFYITLKICYIFDDNIYIKIRYQDNIKLNMVKIKSIIYSELVLFMIILIILLIMFNLFSNGSYAISFMPMYGINSLTYFIYIFIKIHIFVLILCFINAVVIDKMKNWIIMLFNFGIYLLILINGFVGTTSDSFIKFFIGESLIGIVNGKIVSDISTYSLHILTLIIIYVILKKVMK